MCVGFVFELFIKKANSERVFIIFHSARCDFIGGWTTFA